MPLRISQRRSVLSELPDNPREPSELSETLETALVWPESAEKIGQGKSNHFSASDGAPAPVYYTRGLTDALLRSHFPKDIEESLASKSIWKNYANEIATGIMLSTLALIAIVNYGIPYFKIKLAKRKLHKLLQQFKEKLFTDLKIFSNLEIVIENNELVIQTKDQANKVILNKDNNRNAVLDARKFFNSLKNELGNQGYLPYQITVTKNHLFIRNLTQELLNETQSIDVEPLTKMFIDAPAKTSEEHCSETKQVKDTTVPRDSSIKANDSDKKASKSVNSGKYHAKDKNILTQYASTTQRNSGVKSKSAISVKKKHI